jgi:hypothetical protein
MMGICSSKAKIAKTYLTNDYLKKALNDKSEALATEQLQIIEDVQSELNDSSIACKLRAEEAETNKKILLQAIVEGKPMENLIDNILETTVKLNRLRTLETRLASIKAQSSSVNEILADLDKVEVTLPAIPVAPIAPEVVPVAIVEDEKAPTEIEPTYHLTLPSPLELARTAVACSPNDIIDSIISDLRAKLELALKKTLSALAEPPQ